MDAFIGEIRAFPYNFTPLGWYYCNGQLLSVAEDQALFSIIFNMYGGDGRTNFRVPNLNGAAPVSSGNQPGGSTYIEGMFGGQDTVQLYPDEMPVHNHLLSGATIPGIGLIAKLTNKASTNGDSYLSNVVVKTGATTGLPSRGYSNTTPANAALAYESMSIAGQNDAHINMQPFLAMRYFINYDGIYPQRP